MSDHEHRNQSLVAAGRTDLAPLASENPLIARGLVDIARVSGSIQVATNSPSPLKLEIDIAGALSVQAITGGPKAVLLRTPAVIDLGPTKLAEVQGLLVAAHERALTELSHIFARG